MIVKYNSVHWKAHASLLSVFISKAFHSTSAALLTDFKRVTSYVQKHTTRMSKQNTTKTTRITK